MRTQFTCLNSSVQFEIYIPAQYSVSKAEFTVHNRRNLVSPRASSSEVISEYYNKRLTIDPIRKYESKMKTEIAIEDKGLIVLYVLFLFLNSMF